MGNKTVKPKNTQHIRFMETPLSVLYISVPVNALLKVNLLETAGQSVSDERCVIVFHS